MSIWNPTKEQLKLIRDTAKKETGIGNIALEPGVRYNRTNKDVTPSLNILLVDEDADNTDLMYQVNWSEFKKGVSLTPDGKAMIDFYCYSRIGLETNIVVLYENGCITNIKGF